VNVSDTLLKLRVSEKSSQLENSAGGDSEGDLAGGDSTKEGDSTEEEDSEGGDLTEALLSIDYCQLYT
jgi:hypothetical protein